MVQVDTASGEPGEEGIEDEYQLEDLEVVPADYILKVGVSNFRNAWESMGPDFERVDEYGLGARESLAEAVGAVINILGMQPCEVHLSRGILLLFSSDFIFDVSCWRNRLERNCRSSSFLLVNGLIISQWWEP